MKRNVLALGLALGLTFSLAACGPKQLAGDTVPSPAPGQSGAPEKTPAPGQSGAPEKTPAADSDFAMISDNGRLKIGFTYFEPMNYIDDNGQIVGFETEFATAVCEKLNVEPEFVEINWGSKFMELESGNVDCLWNGMTVTPEVEASLAVTDSYIKNYQVVVIRTADKDKYKSTADLEGAKVDAEAGSAGEATIIGENADPGLAKAEYTSVRAQANALMEVKSGAADACVLDFVLAGAMVGQGNYSDLMVIPDLQLSVEEYAVGFRKGSDMPEKVNKAIAELTQDGTLNELATKYGLEKLLLANQ